MILNAGVTRRMNNNVRRFYFNSTTIVANIRASFASSTDGVRSTVYCLGGKSWDFNRMCGFGKVSLEAQELKYAEG